MSEMASDDAHDELMCSMDVIAEVHAQDAEREQRWGVCRVRQAGRRWRGRRQQRGRTSARGQWQWRHGPRGRRRHRAGDVDGGAFEAEGDDEDEAMAGDENISMQRAEGGGGTTGGIKKGKRRRGKQKGTGHRQWLATRGADLRPAADEASGS